MTEPRAASQIFVGDSEMARRMRAHDWGATALGPAEQWPQSLRTAVSICLASRFPMLLWWGPSLSVLYNDAYIPIFARKHPSVLGRTGLEAWGEVWDVIGPMFERVMRRGEATWSDDQLLELQRRGFVEETYLTWSYSPIRDESGGVGGVFTAVIETTEKVLSARRLVTLRELGEQAFQAMEVERACLIAVATLGKNPADLPFALLYLLDPAGATARRLAVTGVADDHPDSWDFAEVLRSRSAVTVDVPSPIPAGRWPEPVTRARLIPLAGGAQESLLGVLIAGLSPRLEFDEAYSGFLDLTARHISQAITTAAAYEAERRRAEALAELDRAKTVFFSNVSHEFRTPLTLMIGPTEEALRAPEPALRGEDLQIVHRNELRLLKLVNTLLDFSRIEAGRLDASYEATDLGAFTAELASAFRSAVERAGLRLEVRVDPGLPAVWVDRDMWEKVVLNLLSNALKHTFEGSIAVEVAHDDTAVQVTVADTGVGIAPEHLPRIFDRFHRVPAARSRTHEGTGIGLALVSELIRLHHGTIQVASEPDRGTRFEIRLPLGTAHVPPDRLSSGRSLSSTALGVVPFVEEALRWLPQWEGRAPVTADSPPAEARSGDRLRALVADDNSDMRDYLARLLAPQFDVETARDGLDALERIRQGRPDVVVSDVMMPRLDGLGLVRVVRAEPEIGATPVVLLSARAGEDARIEGLEAGADDYLVKPFSARELAATVRAHAALARQRREFEAREHQLRGEATAAADELERVLTSVGEGFVALDADLRYAAVNRAAETLLGRSRGQLLGREPREVFPEPVAGPIRAHVDRARATGGMVRFEAESPDRRRWLEHRVYPSPTGASIFLADITPRIEAETALRESRDVLALAMRSGSMGAWSRDFATNRVWWSRELEEIVGLPEGGFDGAESSFFAMVHDDDRGAVEAAVAGAIASRTDYIVEFRFRHHGGEWRWMEGRGRATYADDGRPRVLYGIGVDITRRKRTEQALEAARDAAETANRLKDQFLATLSHELRTPLNAILGYARMLRTHAIAPEKRDRAVEVIERNAVAQNQLVEDLLDISRITTGKVRLDAQPIPIAAPLREALEGVKPAAAAKGIALVVDVDDFAGTVVADAARLQQVFWNLLTNAVKFTGEGGRIEARLRKTAGGVEIEIRDTGIGIDPGFLPFVFDPFRQADGHLARVHGGLGLGLAICRQLVELHGGTIAAASEGAARGAAFTVRLPLRQPADAAAARPTRAGRRPVPLPSGSARLAPAAVRGLDVLLVDDEVDTLELFHDALAAAGAKVRAVGRSADAIREFEQRRPAILVADLGLPDLDGYQLLRELRARDNGGPPLPAIAVTAYARLDDRAKALSAGFDAHVSKPIAPDALLAVIEEVLGRRAGDVPRA